MYTFPSPVFVSTHSSSPPVPGGASDDWGNPGGGTEKFGGGIPGGGIPGGGIIGRYKMQMANLNNCFDKFMNFT